MSKQVCTGDTANFVVYAEDGTTPLAAKIAASNVTVSQGVANTTAFGDGEWGDYTKSSIKMMSGSASGFLVKGEANTDPIKLLDAGRGVMTWATGCVWDTGLIVSNVQMGINREGVGILSFDWLKADGDDPDTSWVEDAGT